MELRLLQKAALAPSSWSCGQPSPSQALYVFPLSFLCSVFPRSLPHLPLIPPPPGTGPSRSSVPLLLLLLLQRILQTWQRCCNNSTSSLPVISSTLAVPSSAARKQRVYSFVAI
ncbi:hypothetical protein ABVT39_019990 [Epinephelus coioides]